MKKQDLINKVNELMKVIFSDEAKRKQFCELCRELKVNTTYNNNVLMRVKTNSTLKDIEKLIDIISVVM